MNYTHLSQNERYQIYVLKKAGHEQSEIAQLLNRNPSTISRKLSRNRGRKGYRPRQAQRLAEARAADSRTPRLSGTKPRPSCACSIVPNRLRPNCRSATRRSISVSMPTSRPGVSLRRHLRCQKQRRKRYASGQNRRGHIPNRRPIAERPASIAARDRVGHWEGDTLIGAGHPQAVLSLVERKSGYCLLAHVPRKTTSQAVSDAIIRSTCTGSGTGVDAHLRQWSGIRSARRHRPRIETDILLCRPLCLVAARN